MRNGLDQRIQRPCTVALEFVPRGFGAVKGLHPLEHFAWARHLSHPADDLHHCASEELTQALTYEVEYLGGRDR